MRIGIYNRWLHTLGGGEKYSLSIAASLQKDHLVEVISHTEVSQEAMERKLHMNLRETSFRVIPDRPAFDLGPMTTNYDVFVNASHMDFVPCRAQHGVMVVFFPATITSSRASRLRTQAGLSLNQFFVKPDFIEGVFGLERFGNSVVRGMQSHATMRIPNNSHTLRLEISASACESDVQALHISDGLTEYLLPLKFRALSSPTILDFPRHSAAAYRVIRLTAVSVAGLRLSHSENKVVVFDLRVKGWRQRLYTSIFENHWQEWALRLAGVQTHGQNPAKALESYDSIWAISEFTRNWISRRWHRSSEVLYPPVASGGFVTLRKKNKILSVGRFFAGSHNKNHLTMIRAFKRLVDTGLTDWEFHLAGSVEPGSIHQDYLQNVQTAAKGYPIVVHTDLAFDRLRELFGESKIYWHATGFGTNSDREPEKMEHFGITTVEAMLCGCVPVVINLGGQPEIVTSGVNGFLWNDVDELINWTRILISDPEYRKRLAAATRIAAQKFDDAAFKSRLEALIAIIATQ